MPGQISKLEPDWSLRMKLQICILSALLCLGSIDLLSQQAIVRRNVNLRSEPNSTSSVEARLSVGDKLTLLDPTPERGYVQVRTAGGQEGWVFSRYVKVVASPSSSDPNADPEATNPAGTECDDTLWHHVYHPTRLIVKQPCMAVTGTIVDATNGREPDGVRHEADGDTHGWLKVDPQFQDLLNPGNMNNEGGNLVFEIVCKFVPPTQADAQPACASFQSPILIPPVGSHVRIVGSYVRDTNHAQWMEIHPVSSIAIIQ
jgi:SH3 domain-containing protein